MDSNNPPPCPPVVIWFKIYAAVSALIYFVLALLDTGLFLIPADLIPEGSLMTFRLSSSLLLLLLLPLMFLHMLPFLLGRSPRAWKFNLFLITLGLVGPCIPINAPMLKYWSKPETKAYFGIED